MHELPFQQFMLKHSLGEGILATKDIPMVSYAERSSAARQALLTNAEDSISMTWSAFVQALNNMQELLVKQKSSSILPRSKKCGVLFFNQHWTWQRLGRKRAESPSQRSRNGPFNSSNDSKPRIQRRNSEKIRISISR